jgi:hypothetical protein
MQELLNAHKAANMKRISAANQIYQFNDSGTPSGRLGLE